MGHSGVAAHEPKAGVANPNVKKSLLSSFYKNLTSLGATTFCVIITEVMFHHFGCKYVSVCANVQV